VFKNERQKQIFELLHTNGFVTVSELSRTLYTSASSVRRDLAELAQQGMVRRSYGGAEVVTSSTSVPPFRSRSVDFVAEKQQIAALAAGLVKPGDIVFLDPSSTCYFLALELLNCKELTIVTNNIEILNLLAQSELTVISSGGTVSRDNRNCLIGNAAQRTFSEVCADIAFFSARAVSSGGVISDCTQEEIHVRNAMRQHADRTVFLCNARKFHTHSAYVQCSLADVDIMISENSTAKPFQAQFPRLQIL